MAAKSRGGSALQTTFNGAKAETEMVLFTSVQKLLDSLNLMPGQVRVPGCPLQVPQQKADPLASDPLCGMCLLLQLYGSGDLHASKHICSAPTLMCKYGHLCRQLNSSSSLC